MTRQRTDLAACLACCSILMLLPAVSMNLRAEEEKVVRIAAAADLKLAIANPSLAPYGRAAVSALQKAGIYEQVKAKLVYGENISQAAQFVQSGNAQAGIIAHSLAVSPGMEAGKIWEIPANMHPPIEQGAVVLKSGKNKAAALEFLNFVKSAAGRAILEKYGFAVPARK